MWIEDTEVCDTCGTEVKLYTDGRLGYAITERCGLSADPHHGDTQGDDIWRDGNGIVVECPAYEKGDTGLRCANPIVFTGEGVNVPGFTDAVEAYALPILDNEP